MPVMNFSAQYAPGVENDIYAHLDEAPADCSRTPGRRRHSEGGVKLSGAELPYTKNTSSDSLNWYHFGLYVFIIQRSCCLTALFVVSRFKSCSAAIPSVTGRVSSFHLYYTKHSIYIQVL